MSSKAEQITARLAKRFRRLYAGVVYDAMVFDCGIGPEACVIRGVQPLRVGRRPMVGPAATCSGEPGRFENAKDTERLQMLKMVRSGTVLVVATGRDENVAHFGDISALLAKHRGAAGVLVDGYTRDSRALRRDGWPVFCRGTLPHDAFGWWQITEHDCVVRIADDVRIVPGDWIFADDDGVLVIQRALVRAICETAEKRAANERRIRRALRKDAPEEVYRRFGRW